MGGGQSKNTPLEGMLKNFKRGFNRDYGVKLTPGKLRTVCFWCRMASEGSLNKVIVNRVFEVVGEEP
jgi:hypothetical protein